MARQLDITPLRSLVAVADAGGFHRAAADLRLSQSAVSQHIRRLERAIGTPVFEPDGRASRLTPAGTALLAEAREILAAHDAAVRRLTGPEGDPARFIIGATDHAADHILPPVVAALSRVSPGLEVTFRFDRTTPLNEAVDRGEVDLAVFITEASAQKGTLVGALPLVWCAAPGWSRPPGRQPVPVIAINAPCAIRSRALAALEQHGVPSKVIAEAAYLGGAVNAARAGLGVAALALAGPPPEGLVPVPGLPAVPPISLTARMRKGTDEAAAGIAVQVLHDTLATAAPARAG
jgi:DNA-binding transcriptional LysR family regulator